MSETSNQKKSKAGKTRKRPVKEQIADHRSTAARRRQETQDALREKFKGLEYVRQWELSYKEYEDLQKQLISFSEKRIKAKKKLRSKVKKIREKGFDELDTINVELGILSIKMDVIKNKIELNAKRLKFCIPELKSMELTDPNGNSPLTLFAQAVAAMGASK